MTPNLVFSKSQSAQLRGGCLGAPLRNPAIDLRCPGCVPGGGGAAGIADQAQHPAALMLQGSNGAQHVPRFRLQVGRAVVEEYQRGQRAIRLIRQLGVQPTAAVDVALVDLIERY